MIQSFKKKKRGENQNELMNTQNGKIETVADSV
jgi:hypothetical protein